MREPYSPIVYFCNRRQQARPALTVEYPVDFLKSTGGFIRA
jgi:hypothetical protein